MRSKIKSLYKGIALAASDLRPGEELTFCYTEPFGEAGETISVGVSTTAAHVGDEIAYADIGRSPRQKGAEMLIGCLREVRRDV